MRTTRSAKAQSREAGTLEAFQMLNLSAFKEFTIYFKNNLEFKAMGSNYDFATQVPCIVASLFSRSSWMMILMPQ